MPGSRTASAVQRARRLASGDKIRATRRHSTFPPHSLAITGITSSAKICILLLGLLGLEPAELKPTEEKKSS
jgi:hypothetical protein